MLFRVRRRARREAMLRPTTWLLVLQAAGGFHAGAPRNARNAVVRRASDADLLAAAAGVGRGMAAKRKNKHVNKYQKKDVQEDPWERALRQAEEEEEAPAPPTYALQADCFCEGAALARKRRSSTKPVLDFDARDPSTFGFQELGKVVGAHGVRGSLRVDAPSAVDVEMALSAAGLRYLRLASRRTPRPVVVASCRELKRFGATVRYVLSLKGLNEREEAARLAGAVLYRRDEDSQEPVEAYEPSTKLEGLRVVDEHGESLGVVWDVLDPNEGAALAAPLLELELEETRHCLVPLDPTCVEVYEGEVVLLNPGLLDLAFDYAPPPPVIRGLLGSGE